MVRGPKVQRGAWLNIRHNDDVTMLTADRGSMDTGDWQLLWQNAQDHCQASL
jgi:hypothetical protein